jgi:hypothetical protein
VFVAVAVRVTVRAVALTAVGELVTASVVVLETGLMGARLAKLDGAVCLTRFPEVMYAVGDSEVVVVVVAIARKV